MSNPGPMWGHSQQLGPSWTASQLKVKTSLSREVLVKLLVELQERHIAWVAVVKHNSCHSHLITIVCQRSSSHHLAKFLPLPLLHSSNRCFGTAAAAAAAGAEPPVERNRPSSVFWHSRSLVGCQRATCNGHKGCRIVERRHFTRHWQQQPA